MHRNRIATTAATWLSMVVLGVAAAGCGDSGSTESGGTVVMAWDQDGESLAPYQFTYSIERDVYQHIFESLVTYNSKTGEFEPGLATSWKASDDGKTWTINLKSGVKFSDGTPFDAEAAKFTLDWIVDKKSKATPFTTSYLTGYSGSEAKDPTTLVVHFDKAAGRFLDGLASPNLGMVSPTAVKKSGADEFGRNPVGTGPFLFEEWVAGSNITLVRNPDYWGKKAVLDKLTFQIVTDDGTRSAALQRGDVQLAFLPFALNAQYQKNDAFVTNVVTRPGTVRAVQFNMMRPTVEEKEVREAIAYAIDRKAIADAPFLGGSAGVAKTPLSPTTFGFDESLGSLAQDHDPAKARAILDEAGWKPGADGVREKNGKPLRLTLRTVKLTFLDQVALLLQSQLKDVGVELKLEISPDWGSMLPKIQSGEYDMMLGGSFQSDLGVLEVNYDPRQIGKSFLVFSRDPSPALGRLFAEAATTTGASERVAAYKEIQAVLMRDIALVPMYTEAYVFASTPRLTGVTYSRESEPIFSQADLTE